MEAVKKVIAAMTVGKDVSVLFPDVVKCIRTTNLELKKLVYLYVMNYAKTQPDLALLSVNAFVQDSQHPNPLIRGLAVRTMGCIRVDKITEYLMQPLRECLRDQDPYVRKTAALTVAKVWDINPELAETQGFLDTLRDLLTDANPMVVANAVAALTEINSTSPKPVFTVTSANLSKLLAAMNECTEWGQVFILQALMAYSPQGDAEADSIAERISPRLSHANSAVVLATVRVLLRLLDFFRRPDAVTAYCRKMTPPLVTLLSKQYEIQYVALRNISLIVQRQPQIMQNEMRIFFCKYNDPLYVKMEKLDVMVLLATEGNVEQVLAELKEYATEADVDFVRKSVRAIGRIAIKLAVSAPACIRTLLELIQTKVNYVVQEAIVVIRDVFRRYPNRYESILVTLCENMDELDDPRAKAAMAWVLGEYADRISNAAALLSTFLDSWGEEDEVVRLQLLSAVVKLFLKAPASSEALVQRVLDLATKESGSPDVRDRGFAYWRLLSGDPAVARQVVLSEHPLLTDDCARLDPRALTVLVADVGMLSSVYHKPAELFVSRLKKLVPVYDPTAAETAMRAADADLRGSGSLSGSGGSSAPPAVGAVVDSLLDLDLGGPSTSAAPAAAAATAAPSGGASSTLPLLLDEEKGRGLSIRGRFERVSGRLELKLHFTNATSVPLSNFLVQFNKNTYRLKPLSSVVACPALEPGRSAATSVPAGFAGESDGNVSQEVQVALKSSLAVVYFQVSCPLYLMFSDAGKLERAEFLSSWKSISDDNERVSTIEIGSPMTADQLAQVLARHSVFLIAQRAVNGVPVLYCSLKVEPGLDVVLLELTLLGPRQLKCSLKSSAVSLMPLTFFSVRAMLQ